MSEILVNCNSKAVNISHTDTKEYTDPASKLSHEVPGSVHILALQFAYRMWQLNVNIVFPHLQEKTEMKMMCEEVSIVKGTASNYF